MATWSPKDPQDIRTYWVDFTSLLEEGELLTVAVVSIPEAGTTLDVGSSAINSGAFVLEGRTIAAGKAVSALYSDGEVGKHLTQYHVTTNQGQEFDLTKTLEIRERRQ